MEFNSGFKGLTPVLQITVYVYQQVSQTLFNIFAVYFSTAIYNIPNCRSQWPRGLRRGSAAARCNYGFESHRGHGYLSVVWVVCCQVEVPATIWSLVQRSPIECGISQCDSEPSILRPWPTGGAVASWVKKKICPTQVRLQRTRSPEFSNA